MTENFLTKLFEHNNWANGRMIATCSALSAEQLDAAPPSGMGWTIRQTLMHLVASQRGYLSLLTLPVEGRNLKPPTFAELQESASASGAGLLALAKDESATDPKTRLRTTDGYLVEAWVVMVQAINHATEHRKQIGIMLRALGVTPPDLDGWTYAEASGALIRAST